MPAGGEANGTEHQLRQACGELDRRLRAGERCRAETFFARWPLLASRGELAVELIYTEFVAREELAQRPTPEEFYARFPPWKHYLQRQFQVHELLRDSLHAQSLAERTPDEAEPLPRRLGPYELLEAVAQGGCGRVYKAWQHGLDRPVAVKVLRPPFSRLLRTRQRFCQEARVMASLRHPNILTIHDIGEWQGEIFFSMDFVAGGSLGDRLGNGRMSARQAVELLTTVARAVDFAHQRGVIHCDLKPSNILVDDQAGPLVADFGLAWITAAEPDAGEAGQVVGTPAYMAPEQVAGSPSTLGPAADVWSLGVILYELLTGRRPFTGRSLLDLQQAICAQEPAPLGPLAPSSPRDLEAICDRCLVKDPSRRYGSAADLADDLRKARTE